MGCRNLKSLNGRIFLNYVSITPDKKRKKPKADNMGAFNKYVDKMRGGRGQKMSDFVHAQGIKTVHVGGGGQKMAKFCPRSC